MMFSGGFGGKRWLRFYWCGVVLESIAKSPFPNLESPKGSDVLTDRF